MAIRASVIIQIARHELRSFRGNRTFGAALGVVLTLLLASFLAGWRDFRSSAIDTERTRQAERSRWLNQGTKGPHAAADQGILVFQPQGIPSAFDPGIVPYTGSEHLLVGHHEELSTSKTAEGTHTLHRLGYVTAAKTLQVFVPLLLILMLYPSFAGEREQGTLRQVLSLGVSPAELMLGKLAGLLLPICCILAPMSMLGGAALCLSDQHLRDYLPRLTALALVYLLYFGVVGSLALVVSARCSSSRQSLTLLLCFWFAGCILIPVVACNVAETVLPSPTAFGHVVDMMETSAKLPTVEERRAELRSRLMKQYGVSSLRDLPVDPIGIELLEEARQVEPLFHAVIGRIYSAHEHQDHLYRLAGIVSPLVALQPLSMAIAGTDPMTHQEFLDAAERYRSRMVRTLNEAIAYNPRYKQSAVFPGTDIIISLAGAELWRRIPEFAFRARSFSALWSRTWASLLLLALWMLLSAATLWRAIVTLKAD